MYFRVPWAIKLDHKLRFPRMTVWNTIRSIQHRGYDVSITAVHFWDLGLNSGRAMR